MLYTVRACLYYDIGILCQFILYTNGVPQLYYSKTPAQRYREN